MNIGTIKKHVAAYLRKPLAEFVFDGVDLMLAELNAARNALELLNDFQAQKIVAYLTVAPDGTDISEARDETDTVVRLKDWTTFYLVEAGGGLSPIRHHTRKHQSTWAMEQLEFRHFRTLGDVTLRYPSTIEEAKLLGLGKRTEVFLHGTKVELVPRSNSDTEIAIDGVKWMDEYTDDADTDWMTEAAPEYLKWAAVCALNYESLRFASGTDGNVAPPVKARDEAAQRLITWDAMRNLNGRMPKGKR